MYRRQTIWPEETEQTMIYKTLHRKLKICATWTSLKLGCEHRCSGRVSSSCYTSGCHVVLLLNDTNNFWHENREPTGIIQCDPVVYLASSSSKQKISPSICILLDHMYWPWLGWPLCWVTVMEHLCHKWPRICSTCRKYFLVLSSFMTCHRVCITR